MIQNEINAAIFHVYDVSRDDADYILESFPIVKERDKEIHGEYYTKRIVLEIYDAMQRSIEIGEPYQTRLDPPPADPRVEHEVRRSED